MITLLEHNNRQATERIECDATAFLLSFLPEWTVQEKIKHVSAIFMARHFRINEGEWYINYSFVDNDGEATQLNCKQWMNAYLVKHKLYPKEILEAFKNYKTKLENDKQH